MREKLLRLLQKHLFTILSSITFGEWLKLLDKNDFSVDVVYWPRAGLITFGSILNSYLAWKEQRAFGSVLADVEIIPPLFILGHWRTGTTHLHNLLAGDVEQFSYANTYQVVNPFTFLSTEEVNARRFAFLVPKRRPMDNVALSFEVPQEDEFAPCLMS